MSLVLLALVFTMLTLLVGALTGSRGRAIGVAATLALAAYVLDSLAVLVEALETVQPLSPFYLYRAAEPLRDGLDPVHALVLLALAVGFAALAVPAFERRWPSRWTLAADGSTCLRSTAPGSPPPPWGNHCMSGPPKGLWWWHPNRTTTTRAGSRSQMVLSWRPTFTA